MAYASRTCYLQLPDGSQFAPGKLYMERFSQRGPAGGEATFIVQGAAHPATMKWENCKIVFDNFAIEGVEVNVTDIDMRRTYVTNVDFYIETTLTVTLVWGDAKPRLTEGGE